MDGPSPPDAALSSLLLEVSLAPQAARPTTPMKAAALIVAIRFRGVDTLFSLVWARLSARFRSEANPNDHRGDLRRSVHRHAFVVKS